MSSQVSHGELSIPALDELAAQPRKIATPYTPEMDAMLRKYAPIVIGRTSALTWRTLAVELNAHFGTNRTTEGWKKHYYRMMDR